MIRSIGFAFAFVAIATTSQARDVTMGVSDTTLDFFPHILEIVKEAYTNAGHNVITQKLPGERAIAMFKSGELDADVMRLANFRDTVPDAVPVQVTLTTLPMVAIVKSDSSFNSKADLMGKRMSSTKGVQVHVALANQLQAKASEQSNFEASVKMVAAGRADFLPATMAIAQSFIDAGLPIRVIEEPLLEIPFYTWVNSQNADLVPAVEAELNKMKEAGRF